MILKGVCYGDGCGCYGTTSFCVVLDFDGMMKLKAERRWRTAEMMFEGEYVRD